MIFRIVRSWTLALGCLLFCTDAIAQTVGTCTSGVAREELDIGNVRAAMYVNGNVFWQGSRTLYEVPKGSGIDSGFAQVFLIGGYVNDNLYVNGATYGRYKLWPGPLGDDLSPPEDCSLFDRIWKINRSDVLTFEESGVATTDLTEWPTGLGAPTLSPTNLDGSQTGSDGVDNDADGVVDEDGEMRSITDEILEQPLAERKTRLIDLAGGERPEMLGDQMLWWIMNDAGNKITFSTSSQTETLDPVGLEIHQTAFAFQTTGVLGNTTFYRYRIFYKGLQPFEKVYVGLFSDPDLGAAFDDYVGSDSTLGLGIVYNADNLDDGEYGPAPPALGYDFLLGPMVEAAVDTAQTLRGRFPGFANLKMRSFMHHNGGGAGLAFTDPHLSLEYYNYLRGVWKDGKKMKEGGDGYNTDATRTTTFQFSGDASVGAFWSENNSDGEGTPITPADRHFILGSGPFEMPAGSEQDILIGLVWSRGKSNLDSYRQVKIDDQKIKRFVKAGFYLSIPPPDAPATQIGELDGAATLTWSNNESSNNHLDSYHEYAPLGDPEYPYYDLEGYEVWQFDSENAVWPDCMDENQCKLVQVFDVDNGVTEVRGDDDFDGFLEVYARGRDSGIRHSILIPGLTNYRQYHFGVRAYAYNKLAEPGAVLLGAFSRVTVTPSRPGVAVSPEALAAVGDSSYSRIAAVDGAGDGIVAATVVNPLAVRDCEYRVVFYEQPVDESATTYDVYCGDDKHLDGSVRQGGTLFGSHVGVIDGLELSVVDAAPGIKAMEVVANATGILDPPQLGTFAVDDEGNFNGFPALEDVVLPVPGVQQSTSDAIWGLSHGGGSDATFSTFVTRALRNNNLSRVGPFDYELRFTSAGGMAARSLDDGLNMAVPFELWRTGIATPDDPSDDVRLIPIVCEASCSAGTQPNVFDIGGDHDVSGGADDPATDWIYWRLPADEQPGQSGYDAWFSGASEDHGELFARTVLVQRNGGSAPPYNPALPETGTAFRITTSKPFQPGDVATFSTAGLEPTPLTESQQVARLEEIGIVPNPYRGRSQYETSTLRDEVRFTNLPDVATIRVFTLNGRLVRTIEKNSPGQTWLAWDVRTEAGRPLASGIYLVHVDVPGVGTHVIKFGFVGKRWGG